MGRKTLLSLLVLLLIVLAVFALFRARKGKERQVEAPFLPGLEKESLERIEISSGEKRVVIEKKDDLWTLPGEEGFPADPKKVGDLIDKIAALPEGDMVSARADKHERFQVGEKGKRVRLLGKGEAPLADLVVGKAGPDFASTFMRREGEAGVYRVEERLAFLVRPEGKSWIDRRIFDLNPEEMSELSIEREGERIVLRRPLVEGEGEAPPKEREWRMVEPEESAVEKNVARNAARSFSTLRLDSLAEERDPGKTGLDAPSITIRGRYDGAVEAVLLVGKEDEKKSFYAKKGDEDPVFKVRKFRIDAIAKGKEDFLKKKPPEEKEEKERAGKKPEKKEKRGFFQRLFGKKK